ncbi:MAG TPA: hypothetical protein VHV50_00590 [Actinomycetota bacterium]|nr:hypothetical protein [Actinomycetota bacterium]
MPLEKDIKDKQVQADIDDMIFRHRQVQIRKRTPADAGRAAVAGLKNSHYCEHGEVRTFCAKRHVGDRYQAP